MTRDRSGAVTDVVVVSAGMEMLLVRRLKTPITEPKPGRLICV